MTLAHKARLSAAQHQQEKARREAASGLFRGAALAWAKTADLFEQVGNWRAAENAWKRASEFSERRAKQLGQLPDFDA